jgi:hypothetical protein
LRIALETKSDFVVPSIVGVSEWLAHQVDQGDAVLMRDKGRIVKFCINLAFS